MGLFADKCQKCGHPVKKQASRCSQCGNPAPGAWRPCPKCRAWVGVESEFCWKCGNTLHPDAQNQVAAGRWRRDADVFAIRLETDGLARELKRGLTLDIAETALVLKHGVCTAILDAGHHAAPDLADSTLVLLDGRELATPLVFEGVSSADGLCVALETDLVFQVDRRRLAELVARLLGVTRRITYAMLATQITETLLAGARKRCRQFDILALCHDARALTELEDQLRTDFTAALEALGLRLIDLGATVVTGVEAERIRAHAADAAAAIAQKQAQSRVDALERDLEALRVDEQLGMVDKKNQLEIIERDLELARLEHARRVAEKRAAIAQIRRAATGEPGAAVANCCIASCDTPPPRDVDEPLTLDADGLLIHLLPCREIILGCRRSADIVTRIFDVAGNVRKDPTKRISRHHARLLSRRGRLYLADGAPAPDTQALQKSGAGTYLDGARVPFDREEPLPFGREFTISLAASTSCPEVFALRGEIRRSDELQREVVSTDLDMPSGALSCLVMHRCDHVPEVFAVVWRHLPLGLIDEDLRGFCICRIDGALALGDKETCRWITPGLEWQRGDIEITAREHEQYGRLRRQTTATPLPQ